MVISTASKTGLVENLRKSDFPLTQLKALNYIIKNKLVDDEILDEIRSLLKQKDVFAKIWRLTGYTLSDYAFATLFWLQDSEATKIYRENMLLLDDTQQARVHKLIEMHVYDFL